MVPMAAGMRARPYAFNTNSGRLKKSIRHTPNVSARNRVISHDGSNRSRMRNATPICRVR